MTQANTVMSALLRRRKSREEQEDSAPCVPDGTPERLPAYPSRRGDVEVSQLDGEGTAVVSLPEGRDLRLGSDAAALLVGLDGSRHREQVLAQWAGTVGAQTALELLTRFAAGRLLDLPDAPLPPRERAILYRRPMSFQFTLVRPQRLTRALQVLGHQLARPALRVLYVALLCAGAGALLVSGEGLVRAVSEPIPLGALIGVYPVMTAVSVLHEFGHATALAHFGGRPRRMGVMLFYLFPSFFCDVSAGWRLADRRQRVAVALSGVAVNLGVAAASAIAGAVSTGGVAAFWWLLVLANMVTTVFNLLPFVKLDGYLALMGRVDVPFLRDRAMGDARGWLGQVLFGHPRPPKGLERSWSVPFGLAAMAFPVLLLGWFMVRLLPTLLGLGIAGAVLWLVIVALAAGRLLYGIGRTAFPPGRVDGRRAGMARRLLGLGAVAAAAGTLLCAVPMNATVKAGYVVQDGRPALVIPVQGGAPATARPGERVLLRSAGLMRSPVVATAVVDGPPTGPVEVPAASLSPFRDLPGRTQVIRYPLREVHGQALPGGGKATLITGTTTLAGRIAGTYLLPPVHLLTARLG